VRKTATADTTNDFAQLGDVVDIYEHGRVEIAFLLANHGTAIAAWQVQSSGNGETWATYQSGTVAAGQTSTFRITRPSLRYWRMMTKSNAVDTPTRISLTVFAHDYLSAGSYYGTDVTDDSIETAEQLLDILCNDHFAPLLGSIRVSGTGTEFLDLAEATALKPLSISAVNVTEQSTGLVQSVDLSQVMVDYARRQLILLPGAKLRQWTYGFRNIEVTGTWGWEETPQPIVQAAARLAAHAIDSGTLQTQLGTFTMERIGDYTYQSKVESASISQSGDAFVDKVVEQYRNRLVAAVDFGPFAEYDSIAPTPFAVRVS